MFERVTILGAGVAGVAAAWAAAQRGAALRLFDGGLGASCLAGGAVDDRPWDEVARSAEVLQSLPRASSLPEAVRIFAAALGLWRRPPERALPPRPATTPGRTPRPAGRVFPARVGTPPASKRSKPRRYG